MLNRTAILQRYAWLHNSEPKNVIMGDDLDAALATLLYLKHNPNAKLVGFYVDYKTIFYSENLDIKDLADVIYIDLDIYHVRCRSLGHHILRHRKSDDLVAFHNSCNLCAFKNLTCNDFKNKYPLGTVHFLLWLYKENLSANEFCEQLVWLADSAYILGQSHKYRRNMKNWLYREMPFDALQTSFIAIDTLDFEQKMQVLQQKMHENGFEQGRGQAVSQHLQLNGYQCQPPKNTKKEDIAAYFEKLFDFLIKITDWQPKIEQFDIKKMKNMDFYRNSKKIDANFDLNAFLKDKKVFSYVFPYKNEINYTCFK
jgi:hypothetical protein